VPEQRSAEQDVRIGRSGGQGWHAGWNIPPLSHAQTWRLFRVNIPADRFLLQFKLLWAQYRCGNSAKIHECGYFQSLTSGYKQMKTKDFDSVSRMRAPSRKSSRRTSQGMGFGTALLGLACGAGVFAVLTLLYHFG
jgi:hypothetical protein